MEQALKQRICWKRYACPWSRKFEGDILVVLPLKPPERLILQHFPKSECGFRRPAVLGQRCHLYCHVGDFDLLAKPERVRTASEYVVKRKGKKSPFRPEDQGPIVWPGDVQRHDTRSQNPKAARRNLMVDHTEGAKVMPEEHTRRIHDNKILPGQLRGLPEHYPPLFE